MDEDEDDINEIDEDEFKLTTEPESLEHGELGLFLKAVPLLLAHLDGLLSHPAKSAACVPFVEFYISFKYGLVRKSLPIGCILREHKPGPGLEFTHPQNSLPAGASLPMNPPFPSFQFLRQKVSSMPV